MKRSARTFERIFWVAFYLLSPALPIAVYFSGNWFSFLEVYSISITLGIISYIYYLNQFIVAARPSYWDRLYGLDRMYRFHGTMAIVATFFAVGHALIKNVYFPGATVQKVLGVSAFVLFGVVVVVSLVFMVRSRLATLKPIERLRTVAATRWRWHYHRLRTVHNLVAGAAFLVLGHVLLAFSTLESLGRIALMALWFVVSLGMYAWHKVWKPAAARRKPFLVQEVVAECDGVTTVRLAAPAGREFAHKSGQFAYLRFLDGVPGREEHPFTISSPRSSELLTVTVKNLGDFSGDLRRVESGARVAIDGPYGLFTIGRIPEEQPIVLVAGGIGITPFLSILGELAAHGSQRRVSLVWSVRKREEFFRLAELRSYLDLLPALRVELFLTGGAAETITPETSVATQEKLPLHAGRVSADRLRKLSLVDPAAAYYLCGPTTMMEALIVDLRRAGVPAPRFHFEAFAM